MAERIKVLHIVTRMNVGGVAVLIDNLLENINRDEFEVLLLSGRCEYPEGDYLDGKDLPYTRVKLQSFHKSLNIKDDILSIFLVYKTIRSFKPDIIHTHTSKAGLFGRLIARILFPKVKIVHTFHGHLLYGYFSKVNLRILVATEKLLGKISHVLIAMGSQVKNDLVKAKIAPSNKFHVFFPGLVQPARLNRFEARTLLNLPQDKILCTFVGRLTQVKRPDRFLEVVKKVDASESNIEFLVVGDGDLAENLKNEVAALNLPVKFLGWRKDISTVLNASDLLILTSDNEAVALTLIEASQVGIPVVTTPAGSVRDIAQNGVNGFVTEFNSVSLAEAVLKLAGDENLRNQMGNAGILITKQEFSIGSMVQSHQNLYKELLKR